jgi:hypothetical protein
MTGSVPASITATSTRIRHRDGTATGGSPLDFCTDPQRKSGNRQSKYLERVPLRGPRAGHHPQRTLPTIAEGPASFNSHRPRGRKDQRRRRTTTLSPASRHSLRSLSPHEELQRAAQIGHPREFPAHRHTVAPASRRRPQTRPHARHVPLAWRVTRSAPAFQKRRARRHARSHDMLLPAFSYIQ